MDLELRGASDRPRTRGAAQRPRRSAAPRKATAAPATTSSWRRRTSPSWQDNIEGAYHLRQVGEADRAYDLLAAARLGAAGSRSRAGCARPAGRDRRSGVVASVPRRLGQHLPRRCRGRLRRSRPGARSLPGEPRHPRAAGGGRSEQRLLAARPVGQPGQGRRRADGAGPARRRARSLPGEPRHLRAAGGGRSEQRRLAARPVGQPRARSATC